MPCAFAGDLRESRRWLLAHRPARRIIVAMSGSSESHYLRQADRCLQDLLARLDTFDPDELEADLGGGVLKISFADRRNCIINRQAPAQQIWMAEGATAWHFALDPANNTWIDTKGRGELRQILAGVLSQRLGRRIEL
jgi:CyaY protein